MSRKAMASRNLLYDLPVVLTVLVLLLLAFGVVPGGADDGATIRSGSANICEQAAG